MKRCALILSLLLLVSGEALATLSSPTSLNSGTSSGDLTSYTTGSITPAVGSIQFLFVSNTRLSAPTLPTVTGAGRTWTQMSGGTAVSAGDDRRVTGFFAISGAPSTGVLTIDFGGVTQTGCLWSISESTGHSTTGTVVQTATNDRVGVSSITVTLGAFSNVENATIGAMVKGSSGGTAPGTGYTEIHDVNISSPAPAFEMESEFRSDNATAVVWNFAGGQNATAIAAEIKATASVQPTILLLMNSSEE